MKSNLAYKCKARNFCVLICIFYQYLKNPCQPCTFLIKSKQSVTLAMEIGKNWKKQIQEGQLSVSGERMCTVLVNRLED